MGFHRPLGNGQTQTGSAFFSCPTLVEPVETVKHAASLADLIGFMQAPLSNTAIHSTTRQKPGGSPGQDRDLARSRALPCLHLLTPIPQDGTQQDLQLQPA